MERLTHKARYEAGYNLNRGVHMWQAIDRLAAYEDLGVTPEQIREIDKLYAEKCREVAELKKKLSKQWIPVEERLPEENEDVLVFYTNNEIQVDFITEDGDWFWENREDGIEVVAWMPLPEEYRPE